MLRARCAFASVILVAGLLYVGGFVFGQDEPQTKPAASKPSSAPAKEKSLNDKAMAILQRRCAECHGNVSRLVKSKVVPGNADKSRLYRQAARGHSPKSENGPCTAAEVKLLKEWINSMGKAPATTAPASEPSSKPAAEGALTDPAMLAKADVVLRVSTTGPKPWLNPTMKITFKVLDAIKAGKHEIGTGSLAKDGEFWMPFVKYDKDKEMPTGEFTLYLTYKEEYMQAGMQPVRKSYSVILLGNRVKTAVSNVGAAEKAQTKPASAPAETQPASKPVVEESPQGK